MVSKESDDIFRPPVFSKSIEHFVIKEFEGEFRDAASKEALGFIKNSSQKGGMIGGIHSSLTIKDEKSFRHAAWMDPFDAVKYLTVADLLFPKIEAARIEKNKGIIHSHRRGIGDGGVFDDSFGYKSFRKASGEMSLAHVGKWKVVTDISNFFDRIGHHPLENHLKDIGCDAGLTKRLIDMLGFWVGDRRSFGVPVGSDASRIISEAILIDVDKGLYDRGIKFIRYVDDYRIFADTKAEALSAIHLLTELLVEEGLTLNNGKTSIYEVLDPSAPDLEQNHFKPDEHKTIDSSEKEEIRVVRRVSGRSHVSKYYKYPGKEAIDKIRRMKKDDVLSALISSNDFDVEEHIKLVVKFFFYNERDTDLIRAAISKKVTAFSYICDALIKERDSLSEKEKIAARDALCTSFDWASAPYPFKTPILRLLATDGYLQSDMSRTIIDEHRVTDNVVFFREAILLSFQCLDRKGIRGLAKTTYYSVMPLVKRAIFYATMHHEKLEPSEKRPLLKSMGENIDDWFIPRIAKLESKRL